MLPVAGLTALAEYSMISPPKNNVYAIYKRNWHKISLDLSRFEGKTIDITFTVNGGPYHDDRNDEAVWAHPVIESY